MFYNNKTSNLEFASLSSVIFIIRHEWPIMTSEVKPGHSDNDHGLLSPNLAIKIISKTFNKPIAPFRWIMQ